MKKVLMFAIAIPMLMWASCKEDDPEPDNSTTQKNQRELLLEGDWLMVKGTITPPIEIDIFGNKITISDFRDLDQAEPCQRDDLFRFKADGTIENDEGPTKCDPNDPQTSNGGTWTLSSDFKTLTIINNSDPMETDTIVIKNLVVTDKKMTGGTEIIYTNPLTAQEQTHQVSFEFENKK